MRHAPMTASTARQRPFPCQSSSSSSSTTNTDSSSSSLLPPSTTYFPSSPLPRKASLADVSLSGYSCVFSPNRRNSLHLVAAFDSALFLADNLADIRKNPSASIFSRRSYGSDYYSLQDNAQGDSERFTMDAIASDYRVPTGYFGRDPKHENRRGSDLAQFRGTPRRRRKVIQRKKPTPENDPTPPAVPPSAEGEAGVGGTDAPRRLPVPHLHAIRIQKLGKIFSKRDKQ